jgi:hypothetical protein
LAADSAVTIEHPSGQKIFTSADKIFVLSKYRPVGAMIFGDAQLMGVPFETIIKVYREELGEKQFATLQEYARDFLGFLNKADPRFFPEAEQEKQVLVNVNGIFTVINNDIRQELSGISEGGGSAEDQTEVVITRVVDWHLGEWRSAPELETLPSTHSTEVFDKNKDKIDAVRAQAFEKLPLSNEIESKLVEIIKYAFQKFPTHLEERTSGVVIAGFGSGEIFPSVLTFRLSDIANGRLKYKTEPDLSSAITHTNRGTVIPFAQVEMVQTFMEGVTPDYLRVIASAMSGIVEDYANVILGAIPELPDDRKQQIKAQIREAGVAQLTRQNQRLAEYRRQNFWLPIVNIVSTMPKNELATMAESLVTLTSLKRRVSPVAETVAGPVDVAVISKGDGFIWIKRKLYFTTELNRADL